MRKLLTPRLLVTDTRLREILRGYIAAHSDKLTRPDMSYESHLLAIMQLAIDEAQAQLSGLLRSK